jgi:hypothetical protein
MTQTVNLRIELTVQYTKETTRAIAQLSWAAHHHQYKRNAGFQPVNNQQDAGGPF